MGHGAKARAVWRCGGKGCVALWGAKAVWRCGGQRLCGAVRSSRGSSRCAACHHGSHWGRGRCSANIALLLATASRYPGHTIILSSDSEQAVAMAHPDPGVHTDQRSDPRKQAPRDTHGSLIHHLYTPPSPSAASPQPFHKPHPGFGCLPAQARPTQEHVTCSC